MIVIEFLYKKFMPNSKNYPIDYSLVTDLHNLFHSICGLGDNTKEQFEQFKSTIFNGYA